MAAARELARHPRIDVTDLEARIGTRYTYETVAYLRQHCPGVRFVWIMGADNLRSFHRWQKWRGIATMVPIAVVDRLGPSLYAARERRRAGARPRPHSRRGGANAAGPQAAGLGLPPWPQVAAVLDRAARVATPVIKPMPKRHTMGMSEQQKVETVYRPCLS